MWCNKFFWIKISLTRWMHYLTGKELEAYWVLLDPSQCARAPVESSLPCEVGIIPILCCKDWGSRTLSYLSEVTQLTGVRTDILTWAPWALSLDRACGWVSVPALTAAQDERPHAAHKLASVLGMKASTAALPPWRDTHSISFSFAGSISFLIFSLSFYLRGISVCTDLLLIP